MEREKRNKREKLYLERYRLLVGNISQKIKKLLKKKRRKKIQYEKNY